MGEESLEVAQELPVVGCLLERADGTAGPSSTVSLLRRRARVDHDRRWVGERSQQTDRRLVSIERRHLEIHQNDVGAVLGDGLREVHRGVERHDPKTGALEPRPNHPLGDDAVVDDEHGSTSGHFHRHAAKVISLSGSMSTSDTPLTRTIAAIASAESMTPEDRDHAIEAALGIDRPPADADIRRPPGDDLIGLHSSSADAILGALREAKVTRGDTFIDLGSGTGKAVMLARLLTGATARGIEIQRDLVEQASAAATRAGIDVSFTHGDARDAAIDDGTVFFMYTPFVGAALHAVLARLEAVARRRPIVVCALGFELHRDAPWLVRRAVDSFWLDVYDGGPLSSADRRTRTLG